MNNYEYIIAGLPEFQQDASKEAGIEVDDIIAEIKEQCSGNDILTIDFLLSGFVPENLDREFYQKALSHKDRFIREYFRFDLNLRNAKVGYINKALGRPLDMDRISFEDIGDFDEEAEAAAVLAISDLFERERGLDTMYWKKAEDLVELDILDLDIILSFIVKLNITGRWLKLDPETGKRLLRTMVEAIRKTR